MIHLTSGLPGSGKTLLTISKVKERAEKEKRPVFYLGIAGVTLPWTELKDFKQWLDVPQNSLIIIDECQTEIPALSRKKGEDVPPEVAGFSTHRHRGVDVYLISQDPMQFDHFVRRLVGVQWHCVRPFGMAYCTVWQFEAVQGFKANEAAAGFYDKISTKARFDYPRDAFEFYKSAEVHTHKRRMPWGKLALVVSLFVGVGIAGGVVYYKVKGGFAGGQEASKGVPVGSGVAGTFGGVLAPGKAPPVSGRDYIMARIPRIQGLPESAPVYDELAKVTAFPRLAGCVKTVSSCTCVTQQGSPIHEVPPFVCEDFVKSGSFNPYQVASVPAIALPVPPVPVVAPVPILPNSASPSGGKSATGGVAAEPAKPVPDGPPGRAP